MVIFDLTDRQTFEKLDRWMDELKDNLEDVAVVIRIVRFCS